MILRPPLRVPRKTTGFRGRFGPTENKPPSRSHSADGGLTPSKLHRVNARTLFEPPTNSF
jgi:hypothetical protein